MTRRAYVVAAILASLGAMLTVGGPAALARSRTRLGPAARLAVSRPTGLPHGAHLDGAVPSTRQLHLIVALEPSDPSALSAFATAVATPGTSEYRQYLTVPEFAQRFGASPAAIARVQSTLRTAGLDVGAPAANHLSLAVSGTAAAVDQAFAVTESQVRLASGQQAFANAQAATLPAEVAPDVQAVIGLNDLTTMQPAAAPRLTRPAVTRRAVGAPQQPATAAAGPAPTCSGALSNQGNASEQIDQGYGYTADQLASAYGLSAYYQDGDLGAGQTIALYELEPYSSADVSTYQSCYGTSVPIATDNEDGGPTSADETESDLDIEVAASAAPAAHLLVYQAPNTDAGSIANYTAFVSQDTAKILSVSWGQCESLITARSDMSTVTSEHTLLEEAAVQGQSVLAATGDQGSAGCDYTGNDSTISAWYPATDPYVTAVGGTTLYAPGYVYYTPGATAEQSVWNNGINGSGPAATGGGISTFYAMPTYQSSAPTGLGVINANSTGAPCGSTTTDCRETPDVSADGDYNTGYIVYLGGSWQVIGGTSAATPLWASYLALVDDQPACDGQDIGFANPALYQVAGSAYAATFSDITQRSPITGYANNDGVNGTGLYPVTTGYDMTTGLGSMVGGALGTALCARVSVANPGSQASTVGTPAQLAISGSDSGGTSLSYTASGLPAGLAISSSGVITGTPTTAQSTTVTVTATDQYGNTGSTAFAWTVGPAPTAAGSNPTSPTSPTSPTHPTSGGSAGVLSVAGLFRATPKLSLRIAAGADAPALRSVSVSLPAGLKFARKLKLGKGITLKSGSRRLEATLKLRHGVLTLTFKSSARSVTLTLTRPAISISSTEARKIKRHKVKKLRFGVRATDTSGATTPLALVLKVS